MKIIFKITRHDPEDKVISVKICRLHSHKSIDEYKSKRVDYSGFDMFNSDTFIDSLIKKCGHRIQNQDEKEKVLDDNVPSSIGDNFNIDNLIGKVIQGQSLGNKRSILKMTRIKL